MIAPVLKHKTLQFTLFLAVIFLAIYLVKTSAEGGMIGAASIVSGLATLAWIVFSGNSWWILLPVSVAFGGTFLFEYKFYTHEISLIICVIALLPVIALRRKDMPQRVPLSWSFFGLFSLFVVNWVTSCYMADSQDAGNLGSITRAFLHGFWGILFGILFYWYGLLKPRFLLRAMYGAYLARAFLAGVASLFENFFVIPKVGFAFMSATSGIYDFRVSGIPIVLLGFVFAKMAKNKFWKAIHYGVIVMAVFLVALGGGRVSIGMVCTIPLIWSLVQRKMGRLAMISALVLALIFILNQYSSLLYELPSTAQRALSILVNETSTKWVDWHTYNQASDYWHRYLGELGLQRWTQSPLTVLTGNRVESFDETFNAYSVTLEIKAEIAAKLGAFESGLWTVLALMGVVGASLYVGVFRFLLGQPFLVLKKDGIIGPVQALGFIAIIQFSLWVIFCWIAGGFPSYELMMAVFANVACSDEALMSVSKQEAPHSS
ncbi:MAG: hypothetical protein WCS52_07585 [bacterium]